MQFELPCSYKPRYTSKFFVVNVVTTRIIAVERAWEGYLAR